MGTNTIATKGATPGHVCEAQVSTARGGVTISGTIHLPDPEAVNAFCVVVRQAYQESRAIRNMERWGDPGELGQFIAGMEHKR